MSVPFDYKPREKNEPAALQKRNEWIGAVKGGARREVSFNMPQGSSQPPKPQLAKTPVTIVTGFLGSGKTTFIRHLMKHPQGKRLAVLVNEFGSLGVDGDILKSCADDNCPPSNIVELANGCICCTVADDFIPAIEALLALKNPPDHILVETSGLALPKPLLKAFDWPALRSRITIDGVIALADCEAIADGTFAPKAQAREDSSEHETPLAEVFEDQINCADLVLLTKKDLASPEMLTKARDVIAAQAQRGSPILEIAQGVIDPRVTLGLNAAAEDDIAARPSHHDGEEDHEHDDFASAVIDLPEIDDLEAFQAALTALAKEHKILRAKGFLAVKSKPLRWLVQSVGARVRSQYDRPWAGAPRRSQLIVIAERADLDVDAIRRRLDVYTP